MEAQENSNKGKLLLVTVPIGNYADTTIRAVNSLLDSDIILCENKKESMRFLKYFDISKDIHIINEHNEKENVFDYIALIKDGKTISLISDCGTPAFEDPGNIILEECIKNNITIEFIHGANSILTSIITSGLNISRFYYRGFLSPKKDIRKQQIFRLAGINVPVVIMETPYRLMSILADLQKYLRNARIILCFNMTMKSEKIYRGGIDEIIRVVNEELEEFNFKGEFIIVIQN